MRQLKLHSPVAERILRNWIKLTGFVSAVLLSHEREIGADELVALVEDAARQIARETLPVAQAVSETKRGVELIH